VRNWRRVNCENWRLYVWHLKCETVVASVLRAIAGRWLVETENPSTCATVNWKVCKWAITLYCLYVCVIKCECVTQLLINPIIWTRTCHFSGMYHHTRHNIFTCGRRESSPDNIYINKVRTWAPHYKNGATDGMHAGQNGRNHRRHEGLVKRDKGPMINDGGVSGQ
jgi:hypothetical protein